VKWLLRLLRLAPREVRVSPERFRELLLACVKSAGRKLKGLKVAHFVPGDRFVKTSMGDVCARVPGREWALGHNDVPGQIVVAYRPDTGYAAAWVVEHEVCHQIARDHGLQRGDVVHCPEFRGKGIVGWV